MPLYSENRSPNRFVTDDRAVNWHSRSFKVNHFCCNRKHIYDFRLVTNCHISSISHRLREVENHHTLVWVPRSRGPPSNFAVKLTVRKPSDANFNCLVTIHSSHKRQTTNRLHTMTISEHCNVSRQRNLSLCNKIINLWLKLECFIAD